MENGFETFGSDDLKLWFLIAGPNGLAPQYPAGTAVAGALFAALLGPRGLILLNALAAPLILLFGTYFLEYALMRCWSCRRSVGWRSCIRRRRFG